MFQMQLKVTIQEILFLLLFRLGINHHISYSEDFFSFGYILLHYMLLSLISIFLTKTECNAEKDQGFFF